MTASSGTSADAGSDLNTDNLNKASAKRYVSKDIIEQLTENIKNAILDSDLNIEAIPDDLEGKIIETILDSFGSFIENNNTLYFTLMVTAVIYDICRKLFQFSGLSNLV